jgi:hypothetical protein
MQSKKQVDFIDIVIDLLVENFLKPLNQLSREKNYFVHVASLAEIVDWSQDFWNQYFDLPDDWETFRSSDRNIFRAENINDFIVAFGEEKFKTFCIENADYPEYFLEKYSALELNGGKADSF